MRIAVVAVNSRIAREIEEVSNISQKVLATGGISVLLGFSCNFELPFFIGFPETSRRKRVACLREDSGT